MKNNLSLFLISLILCSYAYSIETFISSSYKEASLNHASNNLKSSDYSDTLLLSKSNDNESNNNKFHKFNLSNTTYSIANEENNDEVFLETYSLSPHEEENKNQTDTSSILAQRTQTKDVETSTVFKNEHNLEYVYETYTMPSKLWYYYKKQPVSSFTLNNDLTFHDAFTKDMIIPYEMYELDIFMTLYIRHSRKTSSTASFYSGIELEFYFDEVLLDRYYTSDNGKNTHSKYELIHLEGSVFKTIAGEHRLTVKARCLYTNNTIQVMTLSGRYNILAMTGYPSNI